MMKRYMISWVDLVSVEIPRPLEGMRWWPRWLRRPSRYVSEWQRRGVQIEADNVRDILVRTESASRADLQIEECAGSSPYVEKPNRKLLIPEATTQAGPAPWFENDGCYWPGEARKRQQADDD